jgi:cold-inducible RNA-binding protein
MSGGRKPNRVRGSIPSESILASLSPSRLLGRQIGPFHFRPGKQTAGRRPVFQEFPLGRKLYVGNLSYNVQDSDLEALFAHYGPVQSAQVIMDRESGRSKGFGFVEMENESDAMSAIEGLKEHEYDGRRLNVNEAKPREARTPAYANGGSGRGSYGSSR